MIELKNINKYYDKLHVLKDVNLCLPDKGLISIVGESGSGKTTLLHIIGGLDSYQGEISYDGKELNTKSLDEFRRTSIGIIFQNYLLFDNLSVYDNLAMCLKSIGVTDKEEINKRISYVLNQVGMYKMRKKNVKNLSGGQQQKVSIARALLKETKILLADEPTGNLDRKNTIDIMNILKQISKSALVLLVTHNNEMANYYSDKIIKIKDGITKDCNLEEANKQLNNAIDDIIYLEDYNKSILADDKLEAEVYGEVPNCQIKLIFRDKRLFIASEYPLGIIDLKKIKEKREVFTVNNSLTANYDSSWYNNTKVTKNSLIKFKDAVINFFKPKKFKYHLKNFIFFALGIVLAISLANFYNINYIDTNSFLYADNAYSIYKKDFSTDKIIDKNFADYKSLPNISSFLNYKIGSVCDYSLDGSYENQDLFLTVETNLLFMSDIAKEELFLGDRSDIVISSGLAKALYKTNDYNSLIGKTIKVKSDNNEYIGLISGIILDSGKLSYLPERIMSNFVTNASFSIVGGFETLTSLTGYDYELVSSPISTSSIPCYVLENSDYQIGDYINNSIQVVSYIRVNNLEEVYDNNVIFTDGSYIIEYNRDRMRKDTNGVYTKDSISYQVKEGLDLTEENQYNSCLAPYLSNYKIGDTFKPTGSKEFYTVCGLYVSNYNDCYNRMIITKKSAIINYNSSVQLAFKTDDIESVKTSISDAYYVQNVYDYNVDIIRSSKQMDRAIYGIVSIILFIVYAIFVYFALRSKVLKEEHNIAIYRSLGAKKLVFVKDHFKDIGVLTLFISMPAYCLTYLVLYLINVTSNFLINNTLIFLNVWIFLLGLGIMIILNFGIGLIPLFQLLRQKPAKLIAKYDL